ncbi:hypothetical protein FQA39_LY19230 [Lamprigera yunnana]|nr:hypothetical protein FQA39_LY19230 [Lamprigera yunnana]
MKLMAKKGGLILPSIIPTDETLAITSCDEVSAKMETPWSSLQSAICPDDLSILRFFGPPTTIASRKQAMTYLIPAMQDDEYITKIEPSPVPKTHADQSARPPPNNKPIPDSPRLNACSESAQLASEITADTVSFDGRQVP